MAPHTKLPRPAGFVRTSYDPTSPMNWGIVAAEFHTFVYPNIRTALKALLQAAITLHAQRLEAGTSSLLTDHMFFRGQADVTHRLLPTRLRPKPSPAKSRSRYAVDAGPPDKDPREHFGDWYEEIEEFRSVDDSANELPAEELARRDAAERAAIERAKAHPLYASLDEFRMRAAVRHYAGVPSDLMDVSTHPEVAAFFATGGGSPRPPAAGTIGMLWAIDLNFLAGIFRIRTKATPDAVRISLHEARESWGDNKKMFEDQGIVAARMELIAAMLPFHRPAAQYARFLSLSGEQEQRLPLKSELTWWSILERRAYPCAFIQDGTVYENPERGITAAELLPEKDEASSVFQRTFRDGLGL